MKKLKIIAFSLLSMFAVSSLNSINAQVLSKGDFIFDAYMGTPKTYELTNRNAVKRFERQDGYLVYSGIAPFGISTEYMISNRIGLGFDASYTHLKIASLSYGTAKLHEYKSMASMLTFNYHFLKRSEKFDLYGVLGIGAAVRNYKEISNQHKDPNPFTYDHPLTIKAGLGARYFITDKIGVNLSGGYGEGLFLNGGLSIKF